MVDRVEVFAVCLLLFVPIAPTLGPGQAAVEQRLPNDAPDACIAPPARPHNPNSAEIIGTVTHDNENITIEYTALDNSTRLDLHVRLPFGTEPVATKGFETGTLISDLHWNPGSKTHSITYNVSAIEDHTLTLRYPADTDWVLAGVPTHRGAAVHLRPEGSGYIGRNTLYLGDYSRHEVQSGCQTIVAIVPTAAERTAVQDRLTELQAASRALPVGRQYRTIRVFVSPTQLGDFRGFTPHRENEIVVVDHSVLKQSSVLWIHEYVHTVQGFQADRDARWIYEASATYLSLRIAVEEGFIPPRSYDYLLNRGARTFETNLTAATTEPVAYQRGAIVLAILDSELDGSGDSSVIDLLTYLNKRSNPGTDDLIRWLRDETEMNAATVRDTGRLIERDTVVQPPLILSSAKSNSSLLLVLHFGALWEVRLLFGVLGFLVLTGLLFDDFRRR